MNLKTLGFSFIFSMIGGMAHATCDTLDACMDDVRKASISTPLSEDFAASLLRFDADDTVLALADILEDWENTGFHYTILVMLDDLPEATRDALLIELIRRESGQGARVVAGSIRIKDISRLKDILLELPDTDSAAAYETIKRESREPGSEGAVRLALLLNRGDMIDRMAQHMLDLRKYTSRPAYYYLDRLDPDRAEATLRRILIEENSSSHVFSRFGKTGDGSGETDFAWLKMVAQDEDMPDRVRRAALLSSIRTDNPNPPILDAYNLEIVLSNFGKGVSIEPTSETLVYLYGNKATEVFRQSWAKNVDRRATILRAVSRLNPEQVNRDDLIDWVEYGLKHPRDHTLFMTALSVWRSHELHKLDAIADTAKLKHPFDFIRHENPDNSDRLLNRFGDRRAIRPLSIYCDAGGDLSQKDTAQKLSEVINVEAATQHFTPYNRVTAKHVTSAAKIGQNWMVGYDRGEFGGGLLKIGEDGIAEIVTTDNVSFILPLNSDQTDGPYWVLTGLNHMLPSGAIHRLDEKGLERVWTLPSDVIGVRQGHENSYILEFHNKQRNNEDWSLAHPPLRLERTGELTQACPAP